MDTPGRADKGVHSMPRRLSHGAHTARQDVAHLCAGTVKNSTITRESPDKVAAALLPIFQGPYVRPACEPAAGNIIEHVEI